MKLSQYLVKEDFFVNMTMARSIDIKAIIGPKGSSGTWNEGMGAPSLSGSKFQLRYDYG